MVKQKLIDNGDFYESNHWADGYSPSEIEDKSKKMSALRKNADYPGDFGYMGVSQSGYTVFKTFNDYEEYCNSLVPVETDLAGCICSRRMSKNFKLYVNVEKKAFWFFNELHPFFSEHNVNVRGYEKVDFSTEEELRSIVSELSEFYE